MIIGITGRAGAGKSTAASMVVSHFGISMIDLDQIGHEVLESSEVKAKLLNAFPPEIVRADGTIDRAALGKIVFEDDVLLETLNSVVHPEMKIRVESEVQGLGRNDSLLVGALIHEIGLRDLCHRVLVIDADDNNIEKHAGERKRQIAQLQKGRDWYRSEADSVIVNSYDQVSFERQCVVTVSKWLLREPV